MPTNLQNNRATPLLRDSIGHCPSQGCHTAFQLIDETGDGTSYAGLCWEATDCEGQTYKGKLDAYGNGRIENHFAGPVMVSLAAIYLGSDKTYARFLERKSYPLPITELQVRAEETHHLNSDGKRTQSNRAQTHNEVFSQIEVRDLVRHAAHLPPRVTPNYPPLTGARATFFRSPAIEQLSMAGGAQRPCGLALMPNKKHILEVRPLRALRPMLSTDDAFCALNLYQLALMSTLSYTGFGQVPEEHPVTSNNVSFPAQPTSGNWFGDALAKFEALWRVDTGQAAKPEYHPLLEEVPYSQRLEIVPFDPVLYPEVNDPALGQEQENPAALHFFDDTDEVRGTDTQAFITHHEALILIAVRGSATQADFIRDADARQVPFEEGDGRVHRGFYEATRSLKRFITKYLDKFYAGQKILITGHSLGGAIALLLAETLRRNKRFSDNIVLYTYGAPRAADTTFIQAAAALVHHRMVNHDDPVPSVPATWMNTSTPTYSTGALFSFVNVPLGLSVFAAGLANVSGDPYGHHGNLRHFMPVTFEDGRRASILWAPGCDTVAQHACARALQQTDGLPQRGSWLGQILRGGDHSMVGGYIPACWAALRRWQEAQESGGRLVTEREFDWVNNALATISRQLDYAPGWESQAAQAKRERTVEARRNERRKIEATQQRLATLRSKTVTQTDVYGSCAASPQALARGLARWKRHQDTTIAHPLAMAPPAVLSIINGRLIGEPYNFDIDSYG